ncbi:MAG: lysylphosphatidylglycerol synthase domain-containing protein [Streptosporangiaceae bacterium]
MSKQTVTGRPGWLFAQQLLPPSRYRDPRDLVGLIASGGLLAAAVVTVAAARPATLSSQASVIPQLKPGPAAQALIGIVQVAVIAGGVVTAAALLVLRRFRLLAGLILAGAAAAGATAGFLALAGDVHPARMAVNLGQSSWLADASFPGPAIAAAAAAVTIAMLPWLRPAWQRAAWFALFTAGVIRLLTATALPMEVVIVASTGLLAGLGLRVAVGVPDRRLGADSIRSALKASGLAVKSVSPAGVRATGSRPFVAALEDGRRQFIKALGTEQRYADLLYRGYRAVRLKHVGDVRPATSLLKAVEHQALIAMLAERAGVCVPPVHQIVIAPDGTALLVMDFVEGNSLNLLPAAEITDDLLRRLWTEVRALHRAQLAHRSLRTANVVVDLAGTPHIVDFSFAEHSATRRQQDLDTAELLASLAIQVEPSRVVAAALQEVGAERIAAAIPLLQPMALSAATRRTIARQKGLLDRTRTAAAAQAELPDVGLAKVQRVRPRTLLSIAAAAAAFYILLPQLAQAAGSWQAVLHADWAWMAAVVAASVLTYVASAIALAGCVSARLRFLPTLATQAASSFINRISPANVGGMALNARFLQKSGVEPVAGAAAVGVNSFVGAIVHLALIVIFFTAAGRRMTKAFALPSGSKLLLILAAVAAVVGLVLATRPGRRFAARTLLPALQSSAANLGQVARRPLKLIMVFGGSALITLAYIAGLAASTRAFGANASFAAIGAVYLGAAAIATASGSPGGLGALEAALVAGLTGIGIKSGAAVPAVLSYRIATYWLPVAPGWAALQWLQRREYV